MKEMEGMKEAFNIFVDSCEKAGVKFSKEEEKQVEEWPKVGDDYWYFVVELDMVWGATWKGDTEDLNILKNLPIFKSETQAKKYYSIIDTINNIVDELGRPSWEDFEDGNLAVYSVYYSFQQRCFICDGLSPCLESTGFFPLCNKSYIKLLSEKVNSNDLLWAFKKTMRLA